MADATVIHIHNDAGAAKIRLGVKEFKCVGANPPFDHPHIFLDMGADDQIVCPYCSTVFVYDEKVGPFRTDPPECLYTADEAP